MNLAKDPIPFLVRRIAFPASVGWFFNTMFNVVDTFWAGQLSAQAIAALSLSMIPFLGLLSSHDTAILACYCDLGMVFSS